MTYRIGEVAKKLGISTSALRFYDAHGLLPFVQRDAQGNREFTDNDLNYLDVITVLKKSRKLQEQVSHPMARHREMNCYL